MAEFDLRGYYLSDSRQAIARTLSPFCLWISKVKSDPAVASAFFKALLALAGTPTAIHFSEISFTTAAPVPLLTKPLPNSRVLRTCQFPDVLFSDYNSSGYVGAGGDVGIVAYPAIVVDCAACVQYCMLSDDGSRVHYGSL